MKKKVKKLFFVFASLTLVFSALAVNVFGVGIGWYCVRNKEHKQPPLDKSISFIEKYNAFYVDKKYDENSEEKVVYLTFDAGYENGNIEKILNTLKEEEVVGAFFILENLITRNTDLVKRMADEGHTVCNHTCRHKDMTEISSKEEFAKELEMLEKIYFEHTGKEMSKYYRPPEGKFDERSLRFADELGYKTIFWSLAYADWDNNNQMAPDKALEKLMSNMHNGAVILLHPTSATNAEILPEFIRQLKKEGYRFGSLDELVGSNNG